MEALDIQRLERREGYPFLIHWAGRKSFYKASFFRSDLLRFYEDFYYSKIPNGNWRRRVHLGRRMRKEFARVKLVARMKKLQPDFRKLVQIEESPQKEPLAEAYLSPI